MKKIPTISKKKWIVIVIIILLFILATLFYFNRIHSNPTNNIMDNVTTTSTSPTAQSDFTGGNDRSIGTSSREQTDAIVEDKQGQIITVPSPSNWTVSKTTEITVYEPSPNTLLSSGSVITGKATINPVYFRLIDNKSGVISEGSIAVVNGNFSGIITHNSTATEGRLDIFGATEAMVEFSNIEIPVRFE